MDVETGLSLCGDRDTVAGRRRYIHRLEERAQTDMRDWCKLATPEGQTLQSTLRRGWYWGSEAFREKLLRLSSPLGNRNRNYRSSRQGHERREDEAKATLRQGCRFFGLNLEKVRDLPRGDLRRVAIAWAIHRRSCVPQSWIAQELNLCSPANVSQQVRRFERRSVKTLPRRIAAWKRDTVNIC